MAFLSLPALMGPVLGPPLGGFIVTYASWHWIFLINIPVGILGIALVMIYIRDDYPITAPRLDWIGFILSGLCLASLVSGFEAVGHSSASGTALAALLGTGLLSGLLYWWHARRASDPILDLGLLRTQTFAVSVLGGNLCRFAVGATPFLLAILLQVGFGLSALSTGLITFTSAAGSMVMKLVATPIIQRFGFRRVLVVNAVTSGAFVALCGFFRADTPIWIMVAILVTGGFFRSLQFTAVNTLTYADLGAQDMSRASSFAAMAQQLGISLGVGCAAMVMNVSMRLHEAESLQVVDVVWGFVVIGLITALSTLSFMRLPENAGAHMNRDRAR